MRPVTCNCGGVTSWTMRAAVGLIIAANSIKDRTTAPTLRNATAEIRIIWTFETSLLTVVYYDQRMHACTWSKYTIANTILEIFKHPPYPLKHCYDSTIMYWRNVMAIPSLLKLCDVIELNCFLTEAFVVLYKSSMLWLKAGDIRSPQFTISKNQWNYRDKIHHV